MSASPIKMLSTMCEEPPCLIHQFILRAWHRIWHRGALDEYVLNEKQPSFHSHSLSCHFSPGGEEQNTGRCHSMDSTPFPLITHLFPLFSHLPPYHPLKVVLSFLSLLKFPLSSISFQLATAQLFM